MGLMVIVLTLQAQASSLSVNKKSLEAYRIHGGIKIDGKLDEPAWQEAHIATGFTQYSPYNGDPATYKTEVKVLYDQSAIYIGAFMFDPNPDSIYTELGKRDSDRDLNADHFSFDINPFNDGVNGMTFKVSASGVKSDKKRTSSGRHGSDLNWDAVWQSHVQINKNGWVVEMKIPYSALRFPNTPIQQWGVNFWREIRRKREWSAWNYVNNEVGNTFNYLGELDGIKEIKPPLRLSVTPYVSGYLENNSGTGNWATRYNGGMDLKYGINESFTLDATLIPDFGQVQSDDVILNLSPFEVKYNEKRQFFTEGTELFSKGNIFYSRRVGSKPRRYSHADDDLGPNEKVKDNPAESGLINATKISGRTNKGLGIGFFNAMSPAMYADIMDTLNDERRQVMTQPFTNYNMLVFDQSLKNNSYISLANTNVWRNAPHSEDYYTANVTATDFKLLDKSNKYSVGGQAAMSQKYYDSLDTESGYRVALHLGKTGGIFRAEYETEILSDKYDPNDMGFERKQNEVTHQGTFSYNIFKPVGILQSSRNAFEIEYTGQYQPAKRSEVQLNLNTFTSFMNYWYTRVEFQFTPFGTHDFYEPRVAGRSYYRYPEASVSGWLSTDSRKKISGRFTMDIGKRSGYDQRSIRFGFTPTFKFSDRLKFSYGFSYSNKLNDIGYLARSSAEDTIWFAGRNVKTISNTLLSSFIFNNKSYLTFRLRHYWSRADYNDTYYLLNDGGTLAPTGYSGADDINFNTFNIDMSYVWRFAPGSELSLVWKNSIYTYDDYLQPGFSENLKYTLQAPQVNSLSLKILYYLDYQYLRKKI